MVNISVFCSAGSWHSHIVVPRLLARLLPDPHAPAGAVWEDSWVTLPPAQASHQYSNLLTGESVKATDNDGQMMLALSDVLANFPVALLVMNAA